MTTESAAIPTLREAIKALRPPNKMVVLSDSYIEGFATARDMAAALAATPALPVPGGAILTWEDRYNEQFVKPTSTLQPQLSFAIAEIADLRAALAAPASVPQPAVPEGWRVILAKIEHSMMQARNPGNDRLREINLVLNIVQAALAEQPAAQGAVRDLLEDLAKFDGKGGMIAVNTLVARAAALLTTPAEQSTDKPAEE